MTARTALVTGATGELGRAVAALLLRRGHRVAVAARDVGAARRLATELAGHGAPACAVGLDVTDPRSVDGLMDRVGPVDVLVNNAGVLLTDGVPAGSVDLAAVEREFAVNAFGAWRVAQAVLPGMLARGFGRIVNVSSGTASFAFGLFAGAPGYSASKTALNALTVLLAAELRDTGVLVNAVNPGQLRSRMRPGGRRSPEEAAVDVVALACLADDGPTGTFSRAGGEAMAW